MQLIEGFILIYYRSTEVVPLTLYLLAVYSCSYLQTVWTQIRPDRTSGPIRIQTVRHSDGIPYLENFD